MGEFFKEHPFKIAGGLVAAGIAAWVGWPWWAILLLLLGGVVLGTIVDMYAAKERGTV